VPGAIAIILALASAFAFGLVTAGGMTINPALHAKLSYDPFRDFAPVGMLVMSPQILIAHPSVPAKTVKELVQYAKERPGQLNFGSAGSGTATHLGLELLKLSTGMQATHVPYKGGAPALTDLVGGQIQLLFDPFSSLYPQVSSGKVRGLAITTDKRSSVAPTIPTVAEQGYAGFDVSSWQGIVVPAGTPKPIVQRLHRDLSKVLASAEIQEKFAQYSAVPGSGSPEQFGQYIRQEITRWQGVAKAAGVKPE
jgi:tripartite-type tricarboxylate transporter receptor subunit TctC